MDAEGVGAAVAGADGGADGVEFGDEFGDEVADGLGGSVASSRARSLGSSVTGPWAAMSSSTMRSAVRLGTPPIWGRAMVA